MHNGFIAVHRKILDNPIFDNPNLFKMWMWCLLKATHTERKQLIGLEMVELKEGQFITGRNAGSSELKVNPNTWYKHMKVLESTEMIHLNSNNKYTIVTIVNWLSYQTSRNKNNNKITTKEQQNNTNNNVNNVNNKDIVLNFENMWKKYPSKKGKGRISDTKKKEIYSLGSEFERCIERYVVDVGEQRKKGFEGLKYQNGSTFFTSGYVDYLDNNYEEMKENKKETMDPYAGVEEF